MPPVAYFGIESSGLNLVIDLLILFVVVLYLSLIYWTYADARRRIEDPMLIGCATAASLFPFVGTIVYMVLRPPEYLEGAGERELAEIGGGASAGAKRASRAADEDVQRAPMAASEAARNPRTGRASRPSRPPAPGS